MGDPTFMDYSKSQHEKRFLMHEKDFRYPITPLSLLVLPPLLHPISRWPTYDCIVASQ